MVDRALADDLGGDERDAASGSAAGAATGSVAASPTGSLLDPATGSATNRGLDSMASSVAGIPSEAAARSWDASESRLRPVDLVVRLPPQQRPSIGEKVTLAVDIHSMHLFDFAGRRLPPLLLPEDHWTS